MSMFDALRISASGMTAERLRMDVIADNLANANTTRDANGLPYRRKQVILAAGAPSFQQTLAGAGGIRPQAAGSSGLSGVQVVGIVEDQEGLRRVYDPGHPDADQQGYVTLPNVSPVTEMVDLITASRGYEANVTAMNAAKQMFQKTFEVLR